MNELKIKRVYLATEEEDGCRILIDRLWPRGLSKNGVEIDEWNKFVPPSVELRKWFDHKEENYAIFAEKYRAELEANPDAMLFVDHIADLLKSTNVTLLYGAKNLSCNHAIVLRDWINAHLKT